MDCRRHFPAGSEPVVCEWFPAARHEIDGRKDVWDAMPTHHQAILKTAMQALALHNATANEVNNARTAKKLRAKGINLYEWTPEELAK